MINSDVVRGHLDTILLQLISEKDYYGYEIAQEVKARTENKFSIKEATLYSAVQRLENKELISSYLGATSHGGQRRYYMITSLGKAYLKTCIEEWNLLNLIMTKILEGERSWK